MLERKMREVEIWVRGKWVRTKAIVIESDLCKYPSCNRKIPSARSQGLPYRKGYAKGYCSTECYHLHKQNAHLKMSLDEFVST